jgi:hypothetical protein
MMAVVMAAAVAAAAVMMAVVGAENIHLSHRRDPGLPLVHVDA